MKHTTTATTTPASTPPPSASQRRTYAERWSGKWGMHAKAIASGEDGNPGAFAVGVLATLGDDLDALYNAITDSSGHCTEEKLDLDRVPRMIWRLARRVEVAREVLQLTACEDAASAAPEAGGVTRGVGHRAREVVTTAAGRVCAIYSELGDLSHAHDSDDVEAARLCANIMLRTVRSLDCDLAEIAADLADVKETK